MIHQTKPHAVTKRIKQKFREIAEQRAKNGAVVLEDVGTPYIGKQ